MKDKILTLVIGILIGAIITAIGFVVYMKTSDAGKRPDFDNFPQTRQSGDSRRNRDNMPPEFQKGNIK